MEQPQRPIEPTALDEVRTVLRAECDAIARLAGRLDRRVDDAVALLAACAGHVIVGGLGKCAPIAQKIAATLTSVGSPSIFVHPVEAVHGDIGVVQPRDAAILLSNSGETAETVALARLLRARGVGTVAFTGRPGSALGRLCNVTLDTGVSVEGDALGVAPMASTTTMLALGDALATALMRRRGFSRDDYAALHPGGTIGLRMLSRVRDLMHTGDTVPALPEAVSLRDAILEISAKRLGAVFLLAADGQLSGILTDGDLRRYWQHESQPLERSVREIMTRTPRTTNADTLAIDALRAMERDSPVTCLAVVDETNHLVGALHIHDLIRAGIA